MSILIKGMKMPTYEQGDIVLRVRWDGRVDKDNSGNTVASAVPVPPHGDLIDRDALEKDISESVVFSGRDKTEIYGANKIINRLHYAPAVIEAEESKT